jgi:hypothetical protein
MSTRWVRSVVGSAAMLAGAVAALGPTPAVANPAVADAVVAATWTATALPVPSGAFAQVNGTDRHDQVVGWFDTLEGGQHRPGVIWRGGELVVLGEAFGELTELTAVNTSGVAVGSHFGIGEFQRQATRYVGGRFEDLPAPAGSDSVARSVNERGDVVGLADGLVILWPAADPGTYRLLPMPFPAYPYATSVSIGDDGTVAASVLEPVGSGPSRAYRWDRGEHPHELQRVRQNSEHSVQTVANGRIAGTVGDLGTVVWDTKGRVCRLAPDVAFGAMNDSGHLLAQSTQGGPWFVEEAGVRTALPDSFLPAGPTTLTDDGTVAGYSYDSTTGEQTAVLWRRT